MCKAGTDREGNWNRKRKERVVVWKKEEGKGVSSNEEGRGN